ncbi:MAG: signal transduction histidine kinase/CheY-like chemotaxis protein [Gammaproteobacteria bacterium]|jgi:signal transduction histidine kinase/CheY-like chemotaxis protein
MNPQEAQIQIEVLESALREEQKSRKDLETNLQQQKIELSSARREAQAAKSDVWALDEVQQALEAVSRSGSEFVIQMDHRIRTTLNGLLGMVELLVNGNLVEDEREFAQGASKSGQELLVIMNDVLDYCRMDAGHIETNPSEFNTGTFLQEIESKWAEQAQWKGIGFATEKAEGIPETLLVDSEHLRRALDHLIANALRFTTDGSVRVGTETKGSGEHCQVIFFVQDTGAGIAPENVDRVCEAFECGDSSSGSGTSLGLGLTVVQRLVEMMGGSFHLTSTVDRGTRAEISFSYNSISATGDAPTQVTADGLPVRARILVVEDNEVNQKVALGFLKMIGCDTDVAWNGLEAIERLTNSEYDLVLMDCMMPELDGYEGTRRIRDGAAGEARTKTPIIALTADDSPGARQNCLRAGMDDYMTKPVRIDTLRGMLRIWLPAGLRPGS